MRCAMSARVRGGGVGGWGRDGRRGPTGEAHLLAEPRAQRQQGPRPQPARYPTTLSLPPCPTRGSKARAHSQERISQRPPCPTRGHAILHEVGSKPGVAVCVVVAAVEVLEVGIWGQGGRGGRGWGGWNGRWRPLAAARCAQGWQHAGVPLSDCTGAPPEAPKGGWCAAGVLRWAQKGGSASRTPGHPAQGHKPWRAADAAAQAPWALTAVHCVHDFCQREVWARKAGDLGVQRCCCVARPSPATRLQPMMPAASCTWLQANDCSRLGAQSEAPVPPSKVQWPRQVDGLEAAGRGVGHTVAGAKRLHCPARLLCRHALCNGHRGRPVPIMRAAVVLQLA